MHSDCIKSTYDKKYGRICKNIGETVQKEIQLRMKCLVDGENTRSSAKKTKGKRRNRVDGYTLKLTLVLMMLIKKQQLKVIKKSSGKWKKFKKCKE